LLPAIRLGRAWSLTATKVVIQQCWGEIRRFMWNFVGIVRTTAARARQAPGSTCCARRSSVSKHRRPDLSSLKSALKSPIIVVR
jgi:L-aspartate oxidase